MNVKTMVICAVFAAIMCVFSVITIPIGPVPITLGVFGILLTAVILGAKKGVVSTAVFVLLGAVGLPVFSGFKGGVSVLAGPTGGYIWSYIPVVLIVGLLSASTEQNKWLAMLRIFAVCLCGVAVCYAAGTAQFILVSGKSAAESLALCVIPFIPFDIAKSAAASYAGYTVRERLKKTGYLN